MFFLLLIRITIETIMVATRNITAPPKLDESGITKLSLSWLGTPISK